MSGTEAKSAPNMAPVTDRARVLVVEDDPDIGDVVRRSLRREGYDVRLAADGSEALDEAAVFEPDAVVLDLGLPKVDGIEVSRRLRADGDVPILMLTARDSVDSRVEGLDSGAARRVGAASWWSATCASTPPPGRRSATSASSS